MGDAARKLGVPKGTLSRWETAKRTPALRYWPKIKAVIGIEVTEESLRPINATYAKRSKRAAA